MGLVRAQRDSNIVPAKLYRQMFKESIVKSTGQGLGVKAGSAVMTVTAGVAAPSGTIM